MSRPRILTPGRRHPRKGRFIQYLGELHAHAVLDAGGLPVMSPSVEGMTALAAEVLESADGLLLTEGEDLHPDLYEASEGSRRWVEESDRVKDAVELALLRLALERDLPVLGICRGAHLLNVAAGGTMFTDTRHDYGSDQPHVVKEGYDEYRHPIELLDDTPLREIYGECEISVSSQHHQAVRSLPERFRVAARAADGVTEAFFDPSARFAVGVQFHPERQLDEHPGHARLYRRFVEACAAR